MRNDAAQSGAVQTVERNPPSKLDRRTILKVVTGTAVAGEAAALGYGWVDIAELRDLIAQLGDYAEQRAIMIDGRHDHLPV